MLRPAKTSTFSSIAKPEDFFLDPFYRTSLGSPLWLVCFYFFFFHRHLDY